MALATLGGGRIGIAAQAVGIAQAAFEAAVRYAGERKQFDRPIGEFDAIREMLANMAIEVETARWLTYQAAWLRDQGRPHARKRRSRSGMPRRPRRAARTGRCRSTAATVT